MSVVGYEKGEDDRRTMSQEKEERGACKFVGEQGREKRHSGITPQKWETPEFVRVRSGVSYGGGGGERALIGKLFSSLGEWLVRCSID